MIPIREILIALVIMTCVICWLIYLVSVEKTKMVGMITDLINDTKDDLSKFATKLIETRSKNEKENEE